MNSEEMTIECPKCSKSIEIDKRWTPGGVNDYGSFKLKCARCNHVFEARIGRDVNDSEVRSGAQLIGRIIETE